MSGSPEVMFLQSLQERVARSLGRPPAKSAQELIEETIESYEGEMTPEQKRLFRDSTRDIGRPEFPYQNPLTYRLITDLAGRIKEAGERFDFPSWPDPLFATLPTGRVNAMSIRLPEAARPLILFEEDLFNFALLFTKAIAQALPFKEQEDGVSFSVDKEVVARHLHDNPQVMMRFWEAVFAYVVQGRVGDAPPYLLWGPASTLAGIFRDGLELFVMGHEFGHLLAGHSTGSRSLVPVAGGGDVETVAWNWDQEYGADAIGVLLGVSAMHEYDLSLAFVGTDMFFSLNETLDRAVSLLLTGNEEETPLSRTHPPAGVRREAARGFFRELAPPDQTERVEAAIQLADIVSMIFDWMWKPCRKTLLKLREQDVAPAQRWVVAARD